jgi:hypothetical protein
MVLWVVAAGLTALIAAIGLLALVGSTRSPEWSAVIVGVLVLVGFGVVSITQLNRGQPVARVALTGIAVYFTLGLLLDLIVVGADDSGDSLILVIIEAVRTACAIAATIASFRPSASQYFSEYNDEAIRADVTALPAWLWGLGIAMLAAQFAVHFWDNLPAFGRSLESWAGSRRAAAALQDSMALCLIPAYFALVQQFRRGRQWSRVTLTVLGVLCGFFAIASLADVLDAGNPNDVAVIGAILGTAQLVSLLAAVVLSYRPAVNAHFREARLIY